MVDQIRWMHWMHQVGEGLMAFSDLLSGCSPAMGSWRRVMRQAISSRACLACANFAFSSFSERSAAGGGECLAHLKELGSLVGWLLGCWILDYGFLLTL